MVFAKIRLDDLRVGLDFRRVALGDLHTVVEDGDALADEVAESYRLREQG